MFDECESIQIFELTFQSDVLTNHEAEIASILRSMPGVLSFYTDAPVRSVSITAKISLAEIICQLNLYGYVVSMSDYH